MITLNASCTNAKWKERLNGMIKIPIKPLSTNQAWQGRRFKTKTYKDYERTLLILLRKLKPEIPEGPVAFDLRVGVSRHFDGDNAIKQLLDVCQKYCDHFDDVNVFDYHVRKVLVDKGNEYLAFKFTPFTESLYDER